MELNSLGRWPTPETRHGTPNVTPVPDTGWVGQLYGGTRLSIRTISRQDAELELEFLDHLSPEFRSARFLGLV